MASCLTLKKSNCKNCYKCIRHCPVQSIRFSGNQAHIIGNECILCGQCFVVCPQNAKQIVDEAEQVRVMIQSENPVYVSLAPSFIANYDGIGISGMRKALKKLGFAEVEETAIGATIVKTEYERLLREGNRDVLITSCCHSVNLLIQKYFPAELPYLADVLSPMQAHCENIKKRVPNAKVVFIGPCVSKKDEAEHYEGFADAVLTFEELTNWLEAEHITLEPEMDETKESRARFFPTNGGILKTMEPGSVLVDISNDDPGAIESSHETHHDNPRYVVNGVVHYCVSPLPSAVANSTPVAYAAAMLPFLLSILNTGLAQCSVRDGFYRRSLTVYEGYLTHEETSGIQGRPLIRPEDILGIADRQLDPAPPATTTRSNNFIKL